MNLSTRYMGLRLSGPLVVSASPLSCDLDNIRRMEQCGAGAVVLWSLFEEQLKHDANQLDFYLQYGTERFAESLTYFPAISEYHLDSELYLEHIATAKQAVSIPIIGSLNGVSPDGWTEYARKIEQAGADALELNVYFIPTDPDVDGRKVEQAYLDVLETVRPTIKIPITMKISPFFSSTANMARRLAESGANGLVLFNRFYQPDIDVRNLDVQPTIRLSTSDDALLPMRWVAILYERVKVSLAASGGVHTPRDAAAMIMAGADAVMVCSSLLQHGIGHLRTLHDGLVEILEGHGYETLTQAKGVMSQKSCADPSAFERANYMKALHAFGKTATVE